MIRLLSDLKFRLDKIRKRLAFLISASLFYADLPPPARFEKSPARRPAGFAIQR